MGIKCNVSWCDKEAIKKGYCISHYKRWERWGNPEGGRQTYNGQATDFFNNIALTYDKDDCLIWPFAKDPGGYGIYNGKNVHRLVCLEVYGPSPKDKPLALHSCGNGHLACCNKKHLRWGSPEENSKDMKEHGSVPGPNRIVPESITLDMVKLKKDGFSYKYIADKFGVGASTVSRTISRIKSEG